jgi:hypothetical protein
VALVRATGRNIPEDAILQEFYNSRATTAGFVLGDVYGVTTKEIFISR